MKGNILIVDDEPEILDNIKYILSPYATEVFIAIDGLTALSLLEKEKVHCIISDINMPGMLGTELIKKVRETDTNIPFIFFSAHGSSEILQQVTKHGVFDFLNKPHFDRLIDAACRALNVNNSDEKSEEIENLSSLVDGLNIDD